MGGWRFALLAPFLSPPVRDGNSRLDLVLHALPKDPAVTGGGHVSEERVAKDRLHGDRVALGGGARRDAKEPIFRIDGSELAVLVEAHPGDVVSNTFHLESRQAGGHHGQVGFATSRRKSCCDVTLFALRICDAQNLQEV